MARNQRRRYYTSIVVMLGIIAGLWTTIALGCSPETVTNPGAPATASPSPSAAASVKPRATTKPKATVSPKVKTSGEIFAAASPTAKPKSSAKPTSKSPTINVTLPGAAQSPAPTPLGSKPKCTSPMRPQLGLDLQGGISVVLAPKGKVKLDAIDKAVDIIRQRIDALGVAEPDVSRQGSNILVEIPGVKDREKALGLVGQTAELRMRPVLSELSPGTQAYQSTAPVNCEQPFTNAKGVTTQEDPTKSIELCARVKDAQGKDFLPASWPKLQLGPAALVGKDIAGATATLSSSSTSAAGWEVSLKLTGDGATKFEKVTGQLACNPDNDPKRQLAIELDGIVESHPQMNSDIKCNQGISGGQAIITGSFTEKEAKDLALVLRFGALPISLQVEEVDEVSPTLGRDSLHGGLLAGIIGIAVTLLWVLVFYRILGLVIWLGLTMHAGFTLAVVIILGKTAGFSLTLAGIAGLIVSIGIAADSFIVYFERIKDEVHQGKTVRSSVDRAWSSAWRTIVAADLVTALAAAALYILAVGNVRGFALMLGLATALDLFVSYLVMHPLVWLLSQTKIFNKSKSLGARRVAGDATPAIAGGAK